MYASEWHVKKLFVSTLLYTLQHTVPVYSTLHIKTQYELACLLNPTHYNMNMPVYSTLHTAQCTLYSTLHITTQYACLLNPTRHNTEFLSSQTYLQHTVPIFSTLHTSHCAHLLNPTHCVCLLNTTLFPSSQPTHHNTLFSSSQPYTQLTVPIFSTLHTTHCACLLNSIHYNTLCSSSQPYTQYTVPIFSTLHTTHCACLLNPTQHTSMSFQPYTLTPCACLLSPTHYNTLCLSSQSYTQPCLLNPTRNTLCPSSEPYTLRPSFQPYTPTRYNTMCPLCNPTHYNIKCLHKHFLQATHRNTAAASVKEHHITLLQGQHTPTAPDDGLEIRRSKFKKIPRPPPLLLKKHTFPNTPQCVSNVRYTNALLLTSSVHSTEENHLKCKHEKHHLHGRDFIFSPLIILKHLRKLNEYFPRTSYCWW